MLTLSTIICIAHLAKANTDMLNATSVILDMDRFVDVWDEIGEPLHHGRMTLQRALDGSLACIGISPTQRWTVAHSLQANTRRR